MSECGDREHGDREEVVRALRAGEAAVFPTDTVYGIGVAVRHAESPEAIYAVKHRDADKAIPWLVGDRSDLDAFGCDIPSYARALADAYWPGPLTLIVRASNAAPKTFCAENGTVALRMPDDEAALFFVRAVDSPIATSSANLQGNTPPRTFSEIDARVLDRVAAAAGDDCLRSGVSSTIVDCTGPSFIMVREGEVCAQAVRAVCSADFSGVREVDGK